MKRRTAIRATRLAPPTSQVDRGAEPVARRVANYWCSADHRTSVVFAADIESPVDWECHVCGGPSSMERGTAITPPRPRFFPRTPYEFLMMRRTEADGERILAEALTAMRKGKYPPRDAKPRSRS